MKQAVRLWCLVMGVLALCPRAFAGAAYESCDKTSLVLTPIYYAPDTSAQAMSAALGAPDPRTPVALTFRLEGKEPCRDNACRLHVLDEQGRRVIATVDLDRRDVTFCRRVSLQPRNKLATPPCDASSILVSSTLEFPGDERDAALVRVLIEIDHQYYLFDEAQRSPVERFLGFRQRAASRCRLLEGAAWQRSRAKSWKITSGSGAVTMIYETDLLNDTADYHDFDLAKLAVSVPRPDPLPQRRDTEPTGARTIR